MSPEKDRLLCEKYPKIFKDRDGSIMETAMAWGFGCGDGWFNLLDVLCGEIQRHIDWKLKKDLPEEEKEGLQVVASQVKEKFGTLRFYYYGGDETISGMVDVVESLSSRVCEDCGCPGKERGGGWIRTLCDSCESIRNNVKGNT